MKPSRHPFESAFAWQDGTLLLDDPALRERARKPLLSASSAAAVQECPAKFAAGVVWREPVGPLDPRALGTGGHHVLELLYLLPPDERTLDRAQALIVDEQLALLMQHPDMSANDLAFWKTYTTKAVLGDFALEDPDLVDVVAVEYAFSGTKLPGTDIAMVGYIDRVDRVTIDGKTGIAVRDHKLGRKAKSGRFAQSYMDQVRIYGDCYEAETGEPVIDGVLSFAYAGKAVPVDLSETARRHTRIRMRGARDALDAATDSGRYATKPGPLCGWCPLARTCPVSKIASEKARTAAASQPDVDIPTVTRSVPTYETSDPDKETTMTDTTTAFTPGAVRSEDKSWEDVSGDHLNTNGYAAIAVTSLYAFALAFVQKHYADRLAVLDRTERGRQQLQIADAFAQAIATAVNRITRGFAGNLGWGSGANARVRGLVYNALDTLGAPEQGEDLADYFAEVETLASKSLERALLIWDVVDTEYRSLDRAQSLIPDPQTF